MSGHRILVLTYHWPPFRGAGAARWSALVKYLRRLGNEVTVLTTPVFGELESDRADGVLRTNDLAASQRLRRLLRRPPLERLEGGAPQIDVAPPAAFTKVVVPDAHAITWVPAATRAALRLLRAEDFDCVITSSPPESVHLAGLALGRRRLAWVADLRDGWTFESLRPPFPTRPQRRLDARLERSVARHADAIVCATPQLCEDLHARFGADTTTVPNAWDPDLEEEIAGAQPPALEADRVNLLFTGTLGNVRGRDDRGLFTALRELGAEDPAFGRRLRLVIAGSMNEEAQALVASPELAPMIRHLGVLSRPEALALQRQAAALLLITSASDASVASMKVYEYLAAGRPILALAGDNQAARIVEETGTGTSVSPDDVAGIRQALTELASGDFGRDYAPRERSPYTYPAPAETLAAVIDRAVARRRDRS